RLKAKKPAQRDKSRYEDGQKFCSYCEVFMKADGLRCPCCNKQMKIRSNNKALREVMFNRI
ncbi:MAG: hypothetical protein KC444_08915, partial [Nitrosopumilus sp.]|nr:hypothetical protein [Nitrosopumilus sp.]